MTCFTSGCESSVPLSAIRGTHILYTVPVVYPLIYGFIYTNEVVREVPAVVVDASRSSLSREYLRKVDATPISTS